MEEKEQPKDEALMHDFKESSSASSFFSMKVLVILLIAILFGSGTGYLLAGSGGTSGNLIQKAGLPGGSGVEKGKTYGSDDKVFSDTTEGKLMVGGIEGEGAYHLERGSGKEQWAYLTSSTLDLTQFVGRKVKVWGKTEKAQVAPWLMDAGRVEVLE